jgi:MaoC like domain
MVVSPEPWIVVARNNAEHARNPIHTDAGAQAAGFPRALVAGVTTYAYLTHPIVVAWGVDWLTRGGGDVRFHSPVCQDDTLHLVPQQDGNDDVVVNALVGGDPARASLRARRDSGAPPPMRAGELLRPREIRLEGEYGSDYGQRGGDDLDVFAALSIVHPAVWPALANYVVHREVARGSWIHTRSIIRHHATARDGAVATVHAVVVERIDSRAGERAVLDVRIEVEGRPVATLEHHAIVALPGAAAP